MIQTESTPNPESIKFLSEKVISSIGTEEFQRDNIGKITNPFIKELLTFKGVELVLLSKNFLSVKKTKDTNWNELKPMIISHLNHYFENNKEPILKDEIKNINSNAVRRCGRVMKYECGRLDSRARNAHAENSLSIGTTHVRARVLCTTGH